MITPKEFNQRQANAERNLRNAVANVEHALEWLKLDKPTHKPTGTVPWAYDLNEANGLLQQAIGDIVAALNNAVDPDIEIEKFPKVATP